MSRNVVIGLAVALIALVLLVTFGQRGTTSSGTGDLFVPGLEGALGDLESVTVVKANGETVATLERRPDSWVVSNKNGYTASATKLRQALTALAEAHILEQKTSTPTLYSKLGVEDVAAADAAGVSVTFAAGGRELPTVILGNAEGSKYRYARRADDAQSYLIDKNPDFPRTAAQWVDAQIIDVRSDRVRSVTITHAGGEVVSIAKDTPELANYDVANVPNGRELLYPGVANVVGNALRELNLEDVEPVDANAAQQPTIAEFRTFDGLVVRATGSKRGDDSWVTFEASVDAEQAARAAAAAAPPSPAAPPADGAAAPAAAPAATPPPDPAAEAARINAKVGGWRYKIAAYQYDQMTRSMSDLLKPPA